VPLPGSPALNAGDPAFSPPPVWDQRGTGFPRVQNERIDIGAVEVFYFTFVGFEPPVANPPVFNVVQAGQTVPMRFSLGGWQGLSIFAPGYPRSEPIACTSSTQATGIDATASAAASELTYDAETGTYNYLWRTDRKWAGTCRRLTLKFTDGAEYSANFRFR
jgi:hypothetical protein